MITYPAAAGQAWYYDAVDDGWNSDHVELGCRVRGSLDRPRLQAALNQLVARHPSLRTTFIKRESRVYQRIHDPAPLPLVNLDGTDAAAVNAVATDPFQLHGGRLTRAALCRLSDDDHLLILNSHHSVCDGWSWTLLYNDLAELYRALGEDRPPRLGPPPLHMGDYAVWEAGALAKPVPAFWRQQLATGNPRLRYGRGPTADARPATIRTQLLPEVSAEAAGRLQELATELHTSLPRVVGACVLAAVAQYGDEMITVALAAANRSRPGLADVVGNLADQVPVLVDLHGDPTVAELIVRYHQALDTVYAHPWPSEALRHVMRENPERATGPLFDVELNWLARAATHRGRGEETGELTPAKIDVPAEEMTVHFDRWHDRRSRFNFAHQPAPGGGPISGLLIVNLATVSEADAERLGHRVTAVIEQVSKKPSLHVAAFAGVGR